MDGEARQGLQSPQEPEALQMTVFTPGYSPGHLDVVDDENISGEVRPSNLQATSHPSGVPLHQTPQWPCGQGMGTPTFPTAIVSQPVWHIAAPREPMFPQVQALPPVPVAAPLGWPISPLLIPCPQPSPTVSAASALGPPQWPPLPRELAPGGFSPQTLKEMAELHQSLADQYRQLLATMTAEPPQYPESAHTRASQGGSSSSPSTGPQQRTAILDSKSSSSESPTRRVTVMLRGLPNTISRDDLQNILDSKGFRGCYDFLYLPFDFRQETNLGYAFVNMRTHEDSLRLMDKLDGFRDWVCGSDKVCAVAWGTPGQQGLDQHIKRYRNSPVMHPHLPDRFKPCIFDEQGVPVPFPPPTKTLKKPRMYHKTGSEEESDEEGEK